MSIFPSNSNISSTTPTAIINYFSSGGVAPVNINGGNFKSVLSGALTANVLKSVLSIQGGGVLKICALYAGDTTSRTLRLRVTLDGTQVFDATTNAATTASASNVAVGNIIGSNPYSINGERIPFNKSCLVEIASNLTETDKVYTLLAYELE